MSNVFFIADTHFYHEGVLRFEREARPFDSVEDMNEILVKLWNETVGKRDTVWHLGDVMLGSKKDLSILDRLNGQKNLIMGNHDSWQTGQQWSSKFRKVLGVHKYDGYILSHIPIHPNQFYRFKGNVHGHLHSKHVMREKRTFFGGTKEVVDERYINVSCEHHGLRPVAWEVLKYNHRLLSGG